MSKKDKMCIKEGIPRQVNGKEAKLPPQGPWVPSWSGNWHPTCYTAKKINTH